MSAAAREPGRGDEPARKRLRIGFVLARDFTMAPFAMFVDTLRLASDVGDRSGRVHCDWEVVSASGHLVKSSAGIAVAPTAGLGDPARFSHLAVVGGLLRQDEPLDAASVDFLRRAAAAGVTLVGVCTGSFILARVGLMDGRTACVSWFHHEEFREHFPAIAVVADRLFFVDGNRITCSGGAGAADLAAYLVERHLGLALKEKALQVLQIEKARAPSDPQARSPLGVEVEDPRVRRILLLMEQAMAEPLRIGALAERAGLSTRQLERLFVDRLGMGPGAAYLRVRLRAAHWLVVNTRRAMIDIAAATGFPDASHFARRFREAFQVTPTALRRAGGAGQGRSPGEPEGASPGGSGGSAAAIADWVVLPR